jgi:hypothetical protein
VDTRELKLKLKLRLRRAGNALLGFLTVHMLRAARSACTPRKPSTASLKAMPP